MYVLAEEPIILSAVICPQRVITYLSKPATCLDKQTAIHYAVEAVPYVATQSSSFLVSLAFRLSTQHEYIAM